VIGTGSRNSGACSDEERRIGDRGMVEEGAEHDMNDI
jgi:hypothetical protein